MLSAECSAKLSAQSPPCRRKASPLATLARARFSLRASPAKTSGGKPASCCSTPSSASRSGNAGTCWIGLLLQLLGVHRSVMTLSPVSLDVLVVHRNKRHETAPIHDIVEKASADRSYARERPSG